MGKKNGGNVEIRTLVASLLRRSPSARLRPLVGKAKKLRRRVSSYFRHSHASPRLNKLVELIEDISTIRTETEAEALIVEAKLIRRYSPFFNVELKMSDKYPYIRITDEDFPRLETQAR